MEEIAAQQACGKKIELWFQDEPSIRHSKALRALEPLAHSARGGPKNKIARPKLVKDGAKRGTRPPCISDSL